MNCKLARIASNPGQYSAICRVVLVISQFDRSRSGSYVTASARGHIVRHMPLPLGLSLDNYAHALTVDTRPFLFSGGRAWVQGLRLPKHMHVGKQQELIETNCSVGVN